MRLKLSEDKNELYMDIATEQIVNRIVNKIINETKWNGNGEEFSLTRTKNIIPVKLYHVSPKSKMNMIQKYGLWATVGDTYQEWWNYDGPNGESPDRDELPDCVFLTANPLQWYDNLENNENYNIWEIDTNYLDKDKLYKDPDSSMGRKGSYCYTDDIPVSAIKLIK